MSKKRKPIRKPCQKSTKPHPEKTGSVGSGGIDIPDSPVEPATPAPDQPPVRSDCLVSADLWRSVQSEYYAGSNRDEIRRRVQSLEPILWASIRDKKKEILEAAACFESEEEKIDLVACYIENTSLIIIETLRRAYHELWRGTIVGTRLELLEPSEKPKNTPNSISDSDPDNY